MEERVKKLEETVEKLDRLVYKLYLRVKRLDGSQPRQPEREQSQ